jgi:competence protein ComGC
MASPHIKRGTTLVELLVYMMILGLVLTAIYALFRQSNLVYQDAESSFVETEAAQVAMRTIQRDIRESSLVSITPFTGLKDDEPPMGVSMLAAREADNPERFHINRFGVPEWKSRVFYAQEPGGGTTGSLYRWTEPLPEKLGLPKGSELPNWPIRYKSTARVMLFNVVRPNWAPKQQDDGSWKIVEDTKIEDPVRGGFAVRFYRKFDGSKSEANIALADNNPSMHYDTDASPRSFKQSLGNTKLVQVHLRVADTNPQTGKLNYFDFFLRVTPRHP